ncbi:hypothetical protein Ancab_004746 [Ancistrocladus abbreviatus]
MGHLADLQLVFLNVVVFNSYMNACPKTTDGYAISTTCFKFFVGGVHSASVESNAHENSITVIGCLRDLTVLDVFDFNGLTYLLTLDMWHSLGNLRKLVLFDLESLQCVHDGQVLPCEHLTKIKVWECLLLRLPQLLGVSNDNVIEIEEKRNGGIMFERRTLLATDVRLDSGKHQYLLSCLHIPVVKNRPNLVYLLVGPKQGAMLIPEVFCGTFLKGLPYIEDPSRYG